MARRSAGLILAAVLAASAAHAADQPSMAPPPDWVQSEPLNLVPPKSTADAPVGLIMQDLQIRFWPGREASYWRLVAKVQTAQGLQALGALSPAWNPDTDTLTIHHVHILRDGKTIDVLAGGKTFTILRRESRLEQATIDGTLTAALQIEDLRVGDVLDAAWTLDHADPVLAGRIQDDVRPDAPPGGRLRVRLSWPADAGVKTLASAWTPAMKTVTAGGLVTASLAIDDAPEVVLPKGAPPRFQRGREVEVSNFASWADVSALMAPLFDKAAKLAPDSPLQAEVRKIAAATSDPARRAGLALALVENQVRYVLLALNGGGLTPAAADVTWSRRFGDCKGKTALLLAVLRALGIEAEPALVSSGQGDGLDQRLPTLNAFDHVIVHATIGGKDYWLDGTREGDHAIADLRVPPFRWALPVRTAGAALVKLPETAFATPQVETKLTIDASAGLVAPAKTHVEMVMRGDVGRVDHMALATLPADKRDETLRKFWTSLHTFDNVDSVSESFDPATDEDHLSIDGTMSLDWSGAGYDSLGSTLATREDLDRKAGPHSDAPYEVAFPYFESWTERVILPNGGKGFTVAGQDIDQTVAGIAYKRHAEIKDGVFLATASKKSLAAEFPAAEAPTATAALADLSERSLRIAPPGAIAGASPPAGAAPTTAAGYVARGLALRAQDKTKEAIEAFNQALVLDPKSAAALGGRAAITSAAPAMAAKALADAEAALRLDPNQEFALVAKAVLAETDRRWPDERTLLDRALKADPHDGVALAMRAGVELQAGDPSKGRLDLAEARRFGGSSPFVLNLVCYEAAVRGFELDRALGDCDAAIKLAPKAAEILDSRGFVLLRLKRDDDAITQYDAALALEPFIAESLLGRSFAERRRGRAGDADRDLQAALAADPKVGDEFKRYGVTE